MTKVAHVQMMVMTMIGNVQTNEANYELDAKGCPCPVEINTGGQKLQGIW